MMARREALQSEMDRCVAELRMLGMEVKLNAQARNLVSEMKVSERVKLFAVSLRKVSTICTNLDTMMVNCQQR